MTVTVRYFAHLRAQSGRDEERVELDSSGSPGTAAASPGGGATPAALYRLLSSRYGFTLGEHVVRAAVNGRYVGWDATLADGDEVVFIPPVSGG